MRNYPIDSPEAAARSVAMTLMADSGPGKPEFDVLRERGSAGQLSAKPSAPHPLARMRGAREHLRHCLRWRPGSQRYLLRFRRRCVRCRNGGSS